MYIDEISEVFVRQAFNNLNEAKEVIKSLRWNAEGVAARYLKLRGPNIVAYSSCDGDVTSEEADFDSSDYKHLDGHTLYVNFDAEEIDVSVVRIARCGCCGDETYATFTIPARYMWEENWEDEVLQLKEEARIKRERKIAENEEVEERARVERELELLAELKEKYKNS